MTVSSLYPVLLSTDPAASAQFFRDWFGLEQTFAADWYVSLAGTGGEIAMVDAAHPTVPEGFREPARGVLINVEVDDVDAVHRRMVVGGGLPELLSLRSEEFGQRHFITVAPGDVLVDVITEIAPGAAYAADFG